jgi:predicted metal-dependent phosphoesterase TrpH
MKFDMHIHTRFSKDSSSRPRDILKVAEKLGLNGLAITDHNTIEGALRTRDLAKDLHIIIGEEIMTRQGEVLAYNITEHIPPGQDIEVTIGQIRAQGGIVAVSHPLDFLRGEAVRDFETLKRISSSLDFLEINGRSFHRFNRKVTELSRSWNLPLLGGSDAHMLSEIGNTFTVFSKEPLSKETLVTTNVSTHRKLYNLSRTKMYKTLGI